MTNQTKQTATAAYQRYVQLVEQIGREQTQKLDQLIVQSEQKEIDSIHQVIAQL